MAPATDWFAIYEEENQTLWIEPVVCWVATAPGDGVEGSVIGLRPMKGDALAEPSGHLLEYRHKTELGSRLRELLKSGYTRNPYCLLDWTMLNIKV